MLNLPRWQTIGIIAVTALAAIFALPNLLPSGVLDHMPAWYAQSRINLGLDLRGGAHFLLEADLRSLMSERLVNLSDSVRGELRKEQVAVKDINVEGGRNLVVTLRDDSQRAKAIEAIRTIDRSLVLSGSGDTIQVSYADQELTRRKKDVIDQSIEILRRRVDETGTIEPTIVRQGDDRILLQMPGIKDTTDLKRKINQTAKLTFHLVNEDVAASGQSLPAVLPPTTMLVPTREGMQALRATTPKTWDEIQTANPKLSPEQICRRFQPQCLPVLKRVVVGGEDLDDAKATFEQQQGGRPIISFTFNAAGGRAFCAATRANIGKRLAIQLDNEIISAPVVQSAICGGSGIITGAYTTQQTQEQALLLRSGALPATLTIIEERTVGADLGADAIHSGMVAAIVGTLLVAVFMFAAYGPTFGGFANLAMLVNLLLVLAGMSLLGASLTLPGIAGLVLTVGMSVNSNVLIYERVREERANGRSPFSALGTGYERALTAVIDANLTALIAGVLLFGFGSGPIRGFATSLSLGSADPPVHGDHLHPHAAGRLGALAAADRTAADRGAQHAVETAAHRAARTPISTFWASASWRSVLSTADQHSIAAGGRLHRAQFRHRLQGRHRHPGAREAGRRSISTSCAAPWAALRRRRSLPAGVRRQHHSADPRSAPGRQRTVRRKRRPRHEAPRRRRLERQTGCPPIRATSSSPHPARSMPPAGATR